ncbi:hypothetical protein Pint_28916 [Pistacia integerrima]|uniref:Uncharacterized protein n=1 Tax=Pistacia integerrima TaxID=434235 RepID=A0ACC0X241_9ROSI|nr:hypothetical protein Pint_28916 [Pistacia integerrima]
MGGAQALKRIPHIKFPQRHPRLSGVEINLDESYLGYVVWLPKPPNLVRDQEISSVPLQKGCILMMHGLMPSFKSKAVFSLFGRAFVFELKPTRYMLAGAFCFLPSIEGYNDHIMAVVCCEAQDPLLQKLLDDKDVLHWGKNIISAKAPTKKELVGYLYLTNANRLEEVMGKLGFSTGSSTQPILEEQVAS